MTERTESDIVVQALIVVILGGEEHTIKPLVIKDSREWRKKAIELIAPLPKIAKIDTDSPDGFGDALTSLLVTMPDQVLDLFFQYAKDLDRKAIEGVATDAELAKAFEEVTKVAFPLAEALPKAMGRLSQ